MFAVAGSVSRVSVTDRKSGVYGTLPVTWPAVGLMNVTVHLPANVPARAQVSDTSTTDAPLLAASVTTGLIPGGALTKPLPVPPFCFTVTVNVWFWPTSLVAFGEIAMLASTNVLVAGPEPPVPDPMFAVAGSVSRVIV